MIELAAGPDDRPRRPPCCCSALSRRAAARSRPSTSSTRTTPRAGGRRRRAAGPGPGGAGVRGAAAGGRDRGGHRPRRRPAAARRRSGGGGLPARRCGSAPRWWSAGPLPADPAGHRAGRPDLLVRGRRRPRRPADLPPGPVKAHKVLLGGPPRRRGRRRGRRANPEPPPRPLSPSRRPLSAGRSRRPARGAAASTRGPARRPGWAAARATSSSSRTTTGCCRPPASPRPEALGAVIGTDTVVDGQPVLAWVDLAAPVVRTYSRSSAEGWRLRSLLERYDHEQGLRVDVARAAAARTGGPAATASRCSRPVVQRECPTCPWWERCRAALPDDEVSLVIDKGALDVREVLALRRHGITTVPQLAGADLDALLPAYLPEVRHRTGTETRLRTAARRARMLTAGVPFDRETDGPDPGARRRRWRSTSTSRAPPTAGSTCGASWCTTRAAATPRATWRSAGSPTSTTRPRRRWRPRPSAGCAAWSTGPGRSGSTTTAPTSRPRSARSPTRSPDQPALAWAAGYAGRLVDLYDVVKAHFFGASGLGLKLIAQHAGFRWRDEDPGGLNSQAWFADAVARARRRTPARGPGPGCWSTTRTTSGRRPRSERGCDRGERRCSASGAATRSTTASTSSMPDRRLGQHRGQLGGVDDAPVAGAGHRGQRLQRGAVRGPEDPLEGRLRARAGPARGWRRCCRRRRWPRRRRRSGRGSSGPTTRPPASCSSVRSPSSAWVGRPRRQRDARPRSRPCRRCRPARGWRRRSPGRRGPGRGRGRGPGWTSRPPARRAAAERRPQGRRPAPARCSSGCAASSSRRAAARARPSASCQRRRATPRSPEPSRAREGHRVRRRRTRYGRGRASRRGRRPPPARRRCGRAAG